MKTFASAALKIKAVAQKVADLYATDLDPQRSGFAVCLIIARTRKELAENPTKVLRKLFVANGREIPKGKGPRWLKLSQEKPQRAAGNERHVISRQSADPDPTADKFPGGIVYRYRGFWIGIGVSGLASADDEAVAVLLAEYAGLIDERIIASILAAIGENEPLRRLQEAYTRIL